MIYGSATRCFQHEECWNARVEGDGVEYPIVYQIHGPLETARGIAERYARRREDLPKQEHWSSRVVLRDEVCNGCGRVIAGGTLALVEMSAHTPPYYHRECVPEKGKSQ